MSTEKVYKSIFEQQKSEITPENLFYTSRNEQETIKRRRTLKTNLVFELRQEYEDTH